MKILVFGIGNPGRQDDGVGPFISEELERRWADTLALLPADSDLQVDFDSNYQLMVEDALTISEYDSVYFVDATHAEVDSFRIGSVAPSDHVAFSTHSMDPGGIVAFTKQLYHASPDVSLVEVGVESWDIAEPMTETARANAEAVIRFLHNEISS